MNKLEVNQVGGFPMTTRILDEIQKAHAIFNAFGGLAGNFTVLSGCVVSGANVGDGFVFINGEVFDFKGGLAQTKVIIKEDIENLTFQNGNANPVIKTRYVTFGSGVGAMDWVDFKRPIETKEIASLIKRIVSLEQRPLVGNIPIGLIALWDRPANEIPTGWEEHLAMSGKTAVGFDANDTDFDVVGKMGGSKTHTLTIAEIPSHTHGFKSYIQSGSNSGSGGEAAGYFSDIETGSKGGGQAFKILDPYRVVHYIKYKG